MNKLGLTAVLSVSLVGAALAQQPATSPSSPSMPMSTSMPLMDSMMPRDGDTASTKGYKAAMTKMMRDMPMTFSGDADIDFMKQMRAHHQGAIDMAEVAAQQGRDGEVKKLARQIIQDQKKEIGEIDQWLQKNAK